MPLFARKTSNLRSRRGAEPPAGPRDAAWAESAQTTVLPDEALGDLGTTVRGSAGEWAGSAGAGAGQQGTGRYGVGQYAPTAAALAPAQIEAEAVVMRLHRHGRRLVLPVLVLIVLAGASGYWVGALPETWMNLAAGTGAVLLAVLLGVTPILIWLGRRVTVTTRRVILRRGVLVHHRTEVPLSRVREVRVRRGPMQHLFGSGDIELYVGAGAPTRLPDVPGPLVVSDALNELVERNYVQGGYPSGGHLPGHYAP